MDENMDNKFAFIRKQLEAQLKFFEPVEELCLWGIDSISCELPSKCNMDWMLEMREYDFKYCPYCGKKIKAIGGQ